MNKALVTVIVPTFNYAGFLAEALISIQDQTHTNWECLIIDDGSTDNTKEVVEKFSSLDKRFLYFYKENGGLSSARNAGLDMATGDFIQFLDADDYIAPQKFEKSLILFEEKIDTANVISNYREFTTSTSDTTPPFFNLKPGFFNLKSVLNLWDVDFAIPIHCALFRTSAIINIRFDESLKAKEDWLFWIQFFRDKKQVYFLDIPLAFYRKHEVSMRNDKVEMHDNYFKVLDLVQPLISEGAYIDFLKSKLHFYKNQNREIHQKYNEIKNGLTYRVAVKVKGVTLKIGIYKKLKLLLNFFRK